MTDMPHPDFNHRPEKAPPWSLSGDELREYRKHGLVRPRVQLGEETLSELKALLAETLAATPGQRPDRCPVARAVRR